MSKPYDAATKRLIELRPADWVRFLKLPEGPVSLVDADLSTVSAAADRLIRVDATHPYLLHNELESGKDNSKAPDRLYHYGALADYKFGLPVYSNLFLLRKEANSPTLTGVLTRLRPDGTAYLTFRYNVIRVWRLDVETLLSGGLGTLPFTPIADVKQADLPEVIRRMQSRIESEASDGNEAGELWTATYVLMGLRYPKAFNGQLLQGVRRMKESVTYQAILEEGEEKGERNALIRVASKRLGNPSERILTKLANVNSIERLEALLDKVFEVETWDELLAQES